MFSVMLRRQDSNLGLTAPKAVVLPLHHGGPRRPMAFAARQVCHAAVRSPFRRWHRGFGHGSSVEAQFHRPNGWRAPQTQETSHNGAMAKETDEVDRIVEAWV